jgi:hypothetical protein
MSFWKRFQTARDLPAREIALRLRYRTGVLLRDHLVPAADRFRSTYGEHDAEAPLRTYLRNVTSHMNIDTAGYLAHRFQVLGSTPVVVSYGASAPGLAGTCYSPMQGVVADASGEWLQKVVPHRCLRTAQSIWRCVDVGYQPIDWQLDFKSGYRWSAKQPSLRLQILGIPGADIKVPWELGRCQHLPQLAQAYATSVDERLPREFRNQVLDFMSANPPRYGVQWACSMDVGIRIANWLLAFDGFRSCGYHFDQEFLRIFHQAVFMHGEHLISFLEWNPGFAGNHYLANIAGLLFVAAYLPGSARTDAWFAFAVQELNEIVGSQFFADGGNFEGSTSYHRLSSEMIAVSTALALDVLALDPDILHRADPRWHRRLPALRPPGAQNRPFTSCYMDRLRSAEAFIAATEAPAKVTPMIGDNDSGRFISIGTLAPDILQQRDSTLAAARLAALRSTFVASPAGGVLERCCFALPHATEAMSTDPFTLFPDFGIYVNRSSPWWLMLRAGTVGQKGIGGHAHNDQLGIVLFVDGEELLVDPGCYLYAADPEVRNRFRSTQMHNVVSVDGIEQNPFRRDSASLFELEAHRSHAGFVHASADSVSAEHFGFGMPCRRSITIGASALTIVDELTGPHHKRLNLHFGPNAAVQIAGPHILDVAVGACRVCIECDSGRWDLGSSEYAPAFGVVRPIQYAFLYTNRPQFTWYIRNERSA